MRRNMQGKANPKPIDTTLLPKKGQRRSGPIPSGLSNVKVAADSNPADTKAA